MAGKPSKETLLTRMVKAQDLETHVRIVKVENVAVVEIRDYIPSLAEYGRGYWISMEDADSIRKVGNALVDLANTL